jgi:hypothetical protein
MRSLKFDKLFVSTRLKENRASHELVYKEAVEGYQKKAIEFLKNKLEEIQKTPTVNIYASLHVPSNHLKEYDRAILMVDQSLDLVVELSEEDYSKYIQDNWSWTREFYDSNSSYSSTAAASGIALQ